MSSPVKLSRQLSGKLPGKLSVSCQLAVNQKKIKEVSPQDILLVRRNRFWTIKSYTQ